VLQALTSGKAGNIRWSLKPHILLALPFGALAVGSLGATSSLTAMRAVGIATSALLCLVSIARGIRRTRERSLTDTPNTANAAGLLELNAADASRRENTGIRQSVQLDRTQITTAGFFRTPTHEGQYRAAVVLGAIALAALAVVTSLVAGQIQRSGPITLFGLALGYLVSLLPAALALHLALSRTDVEFTPQLVRMSCQRGLLGRAVMQWRMADVRSIRLDSASNGLAVDLVLQVNKQRWTIVLRGQAQKEAHRWLELGSSKS
jgi:hypothetical protein